MVLPIEDLLFSFLFFFRSSSLSVPASSVLSCQAKIVPRPHQLPAADAFQVTWSERPGRLSRIRHRNALFEKALEDAVEGQGKDRDRKNNATSNEHAKKRGKD